MYKLHPQDLNQLNQPTQPKPSCCKQGFNYRCFLFHIFSMFIPTSWRLITPFLTHVFFEVGWKPPTPLYKFCLDDQVMARPILSPTFAKSLSLEVPTSVFRPLPGGHNCQGAELYFCLGSRNNVVLTLNFWV